MNTLVLCCVYDVVFLSFSFLWKYACMYLCINQFLQVIRIRKTRLAILLQYVYV